MPLHRPHKPLLRQADRLDQAILRPSHFGQAGRQAVKTLAPCLAEMARSEDGLIEAVCLPEKRFVWAVQWHPEFSFRVDAHSRKIFGAFVAAAKGL